MKLLSVFIVVWFGWCLACSLSRGGCCTRVGWCSRFCFKKVVSPLDRFAFGGEPAFVGFFQQLLHDLAEVVGHLHRYVRHDFLGFASDGAHDVALGFFLGA